MLDKNNTVSKTNKRFLKSQKKNCGFILMMWSINKLGWMFSVLWRTMLVKIVGSKMWKTFFACIFALYAREKVFLFILIMLMFYFLKCLNKQYYFCFIFFPYLFTMNINTIYSISLASISFYLFLSLLPECGTDYTFSYYGITFLR